MEENKHFRVEYLIKSLNITDHKTIMYSLQNDFNSLYRNWINIFNDDYEQGYDDMLKKTMLHSRELVDQFLQDRKADLEKINQIMIANNRQPLFANPEKLKESWQRRDYLLEFVPDSILNKEFNCESYQSFIPENALVKEKTHTPC